MNDLTGRLARASSRRPGRTLAAWAVVLVLSIGAIGGLLGSSLTTDAEMTNDPESYRAYDLIAEHFPPSDDYVNDVVVIRSPSLDVSDRSSSRRWKRSSTRSRRPAPCSRCKPSTRPPSDPRGAEWACDDRAARLPRYGEIGSCCRT